MSDHSQACHLQVTVAIKLLDQKQPATGDETMPNRIRFPLMKMSREQISFQRLDGELKYNIQKLMSTQSVRKHNFKSLA